MALAASVDDRLAQQLAFVLELDRLKSVLRRSPLTDGSRRENSAEHSWHLALMVLVLADRAADTVDVSHVVRLLLVHDVVEIDAGDTFVYDDAGRLDTAERERAGADRVFGLLPADQAAELRDLWEEFEARSTPEARFAAAVDRLQPLLLNARSGGAPWREGDVGADRVRAVNAHIEAGAPDLWRLASALIDAAVDAGLLRPGA